MILKKGSRGQVVELYQQKLLDLGYGIKVDGIFGQQTKNITKLYQKDKGLLADGIAGAQTLGCIYGERETTAKTEAVIKYFVTAGGLNLRKNPGMFSELLRFVQQGETCEYLGESSGIYQKIKLDSDGLEGYAWSKRLTPCYDSDQDATRQLNGIPHTDHFFLEQWETRCKIIDKALYPLLQTLMNALEVMRERSGGRTIVIHSGYRTKQYHQSLNPGTNSMHCYGGAADISFGGDTSKRGMREIGTIAKELYDEGIFGGLGLGNSCVHVDVRGRMDNNGNIIKYDNHRALWFYNGYKSYDDWLCETE